MHNYFRNLIARFKLHTFLFTYEMNKDVNEIFIRIINSNWISVDCTDQYYAVVKTTTGLELSFWISNGTSCYGCRGYLKNINSSNNNSIKWEYSMPEPYVILKMQKRMHAHIGQNNKNLIDSIFNNSANDSNKEFTPPDNSVDHYISKIFL